MEKMKSLKEIVENSDSLADGLKNNATRHRYYNSYTSMEKAMGCLLTGNLYLSNGNRWNDKRDPTIILPPKKNH